MFPGRLSRRGRETRISTNQSLFDGQLFFIFESFWLWRKNKTGSRKGTDTKIEVTFKRGSGICDNARRHYILPNLSPTRDIVRVGFGSAVQHSAGQSVYFAELTEPWEVVLDETYEKKKEKKEIIYLQPASEVEQLVWSINFWPMEIGCRGFVATQTTIRLKDLWPGFSTDIKKVSTAASERELSLRTETISTATKLGHTVDCLS